VLSRRATKLLDVPVEYYCTLSASMNSVAQKPLATWPHGNYRSARKVAPQRLVATSRTAGSAYFSSQ